MYSGELGVASGGINPFFKPPLSRLRGTGGIMIPKKVIDILTPVLSQRPELPYNFFPFFIRRRKLSTTGISHMDRDVPIDGWTS